MNPKLMVMGLLFIFGIAFAQPKKKSNTDLSSASSSFEQLRGLLFQVKTASGPSAEKNSYGTGFVVAKNGFLLTNYHVVESAIWKAPTDKVFVNVNNQNVAAGIVAVDVVHDLALIHVPLTFDKVISVSDSLPVSGANLHSLGLPQDLDWTVINGVYNGVIRRGPYRLIHLTTPLNAGMSGGPTVNTRAQLVGVNVSHLVDGENISFAVPLEFVHPLIEKALALQNMKEIPTKSFENLTQDIHEQLTHVQADLTELLLNSLETSKMIEGWQVPQYSQEMKCWGQKSPESQKEYSSTYEACQLEYNTRLTDQISTGFIKITTTLLKNHKLNFFAFFNMLNSRWSVDNIETNTPFEKDKKMNYGPFACHRSSLQTPDNVQTEICTRVMVPFTDLFEIHIKSVKRIGTEKALLSYLTLDGFSRESFNTILKKYYANLGRLAP